MDGKLVRDKIPSRIREDGRNPVLRILQPDEYFVRLKRKLTEEVDEFLEVPTSEELVDILEVVFAIGACMGEDSESLERLRVAKAHSHGTFKNRILWLGNAFSDSQRQSN